MATPFIFWGVASGLMTVSARRPWGRGEQDLHLLGEGLGPACQGLPILREELVHGLFQFQGEGLAEAAGGQVPAAADLVQSRRPCLGEGLAGLHCPGLDLDQLVIEQPALQVIEGEGLLILRRGIVDVEIDPQPLGEKGPDRCLEEVGQVAQPEWFISR